jgi:hypothetical protein
MSKEKKGVTKALEPGKITGRAAVIWRGKIAAEGRLA